MPELNVPSGGAESPAAEPPAIPGHKLLRCIGRGSYGEVWLAQSAEGEFRAVKIVFRKTFERDRPFEREFGGIQKFEPVSRASPSQVSILQVGRDDATGFFYYVMELADDQRGRDGAPSPSAGGANSASPATLDPGFLRRCENAMLAWADEEMRWSEDSSYGTSFPAPTKRVRSAGWYFSGDQAFDLAAAMQLDFPKLKDPRPQYLEAILANVNYEAGCNPVNVSLVTGLGWKRQREIVHQWALNDRRVLPPSGVPLGSVQAGFGWIENYKQELGGLTFPPDGADSGPYANLPYPFYDRWGDSFNLSQEFVVLNQAKGFATWAWLFAQTSLAKQPWKPAALQIARDSSAGRDGAPSRSVLRLTSAGADLTGARVLWEADGAEPAFGTEFTLPSAQPAWAEAEVLLQDGRLGFAATNFANGRPSPRTASR